MTSEQFSEFFEHFLVGKLLAAIKDDSLGGTKDVIINNAGPGLLRPDPLFRKVLHMFGLEFEGSSVVEVVPDVLFVRQDLMNGGSGPGAAEVSQYSPLVQARGDLRFGQPF